MQNDHVIEKLVHGLSRLSERELRRLVELFYRHDVAEAFREVVERMIVLRQAEEERRKSSALGRSRNRHPLKRGVDVSSEEPLKQEFLIVLHDRDIFPSTKDVVDVVNDVFGLGLRYEDFRRRGRRDLIQRCWHHFQGMPVDERRRILRTLSRRSKAPSASSEGYHELFRILSQK